MTNPKLRPITTRYRNTRFRSRVEARWAVFFDLIGWEWEYEPFDAAGYIPDFALIGDDPVLVEVKSDTKLAELIEHTPRIKAAVRDVWRHDILVVGSTPLPHGESTFVGRPVMGLLGEQGEFDSKPGWATGEALWTTCGTCRQLRFFHAQMDYRSRICGHGRGDRGTDPHLGLIDLAWSEARNVTQWRAEP